MSLVTDTIELPEDSVETEPFCPPLSPKQLAILNCKKRIILVSGPRNTGKSIGVGHLVARHLWDVKDAQVAIFVTSYKVGQGGAWADLVKICLPVWLEANLPADDGMGTYEYVSISPDGMPGPKMDGKLRTPYLEVRNRHGTKSTCSLFSIDNENQIEAKVKSLRFSLIWVAELSTFKTDDIFKLTEEQLRWGPEEDQKWISDTNPAEEGTDHWAYKLFWIKRNKPTDELTDDEKLVIPQMAVFEVFVEDNPFISEFAKAKLRFKYSDDPDGFERHVLGKWKRNAGRLGWIFADVINDNIHFINDAIDVDKDTSLIYTGWDPGIVNSAAIALEKRMINGISFWFVLDELVSTTKEIAVSDFAASFFEKMVALDNFYKGAWKNFPGFKWKHWSDPNVATLNHPSLTGAVSAEITNITQGQVELNAAIKGAGSVESGCKFIRRLLREDRLFVGQNCPHLIEALKNVKHGAREYLDRTDKFKHVLDALRYPIISENLEELEDGYVRPNSSARRIIHVNL